MESGHPNVSNPNLFIRTLISVSLMKGSSSLFLIVDQPPSKSLWVILRLVFFFFAIEFMYAAETALTVPILTSLRVPESYV